MQRHMQRPCPIQRLHVGWLYFPLWRWRLQAFIQLRVIQKHRFWRIWLDLWRIWSWIRSWFSDQDHFRSLGWQVQRLQRWQRRQLLWVLWPLQLSYGKKKMYWKGFIFWLKSHANIWEESAESEFQQLFREWRTVRFPWFWHEWYRDMAQKQLQHRESAVRLSQFPGIPRMVLLQLWMRLSHRIMEQGKWTV